MIFESLIFTKGLFIQENSLKKHTTSGGPNTDSDKSEEVLSLLKLTFNTIDIKSVCAIYLRNLAKSNGNNYSALRSSLSDLVQLRLHYV